MAKPSRKKRKQSQQSSGTRAPERQVAASKVAPPSESAAVDTPRPMPAARPSSPKQTAEAGKKAKPSSKAAEAKPARKEETLDEGDDEIRENKSKETSGRLMVYALGAIAVIVIGAFAYSRFTAPTTPTAATTINVQAPAPTGGRTLEPRPVLPVSTAAAHTSAPSATPSTSSAAPTATASAAASVTPLTSAAPKVEPPAPPKQPPAPPSPPPAPPAAPKPPPAKPVAPPPPPSGEDVY